LRDTRERLQSTIEKYEIGLEELKSANAELVSVNEELQSTNEEFETSKEEIQAINEDLSSVNNELNLKIAELNLSNNDLRNLFESTRIAIVFLDRHAAIRTFTPAVSDLFSLIPTDRGRPFADIANHFEHPGLHQEVRAVLAGEGPVERRIARRDGRAHYLMRVLPYLDGEGTTDGAVVTFVDITSLVAAERQETLVNELNHRVRNMLTVVGAIASQTLERTPAPERFAPAFLGRIEALARAYGLVSREQWGDVALEDVLREEFEPHALSGESRLATSGPRVTLRPSAALALGLVLHELATNAVKYGALSVGTGYVTVMWGVEDGGGHGDRAERRLVLRWREGGGRRS
jgi:two-component system CheB/CheR fusion protein